jgi:C-terminal processing protease CtpA/Prc
LFTSGVVDYAKPGSLASLKSRTVLFYPSRYAYTENPKALPLYVVVDRETWSAAEYFAALLQDNHAATVVGEVTGGAGCGYTNGGIPTKLKNSGAQLEMPDCVRFRADGSNEVNGITPNVLLAWAEHDSGFQRVKKLLAALESRQAATAKLPLQ